jgi:cytochrome c
MRSSTLSLAAVAAAFVFSLPALAAPDPAAAEKLMKSSGCLTCHAVDKTKKGPSFKAVAAKHKGKAGAEQKITDQITKAPKVKYPDGSEDEHPVVNSKDAAQINNLVQWILAQ